VSVKSYGLDAKSYGLDAHAETVPSEDADGVENTQMTGQEASARRHLFGGICILRSHGFLGVRGGLMADSPRFLAFGVSETWEPRTVYKKPLKMKKETVAAEDSDGIENTHRWRDNPHSVALKNADCLPK